MLRKWDLKTRLWFGKQKSAANAAHGGQCLAPCIVIFEKVGPASEWPLKKKSGRDMAQFNPFGLIR